MTSKKFDRRVNSLIKRKLSKEIETKHFCTSASGTVDTFGVIYLLNDIDSGAAEQQRVGNQIRSKYLRMNLTMSGADANNYMRVMIVRAKKSTLTTSDMPSVGACSDPDDYTILYDKVTTFRQGWNGTAAVNQQAYSTIRKGLGNTMVQYDNATGTNINSGAVYLYIVSDSGVPANPFFEFNVQYYYTDS